jgi:hypothetical protein
LKSALEDEGKVDVNYEKITTELKKTNFASEETRVKTSDKVAKIMNLYQKALKARVLKELKDCQRVDGGRIWIGKWAIVTHPNGIVATVAEYKFRMQMICQDCVLLPLKCFLRLLEGAHRDT